MDYDDAINAQIAAKMRGEDRAARDFVIITLLTGAAYFYLLAYFLS